MVEEGRIVREARRIKEEMTRGEGIRGGEEGSIYLLVSVSICHRNENLHDGQGQRP